MASTASSTLPWRLATRSMPSASRNLLKEVCSLGRAWNLLESRFRFVLRDLWPIHRPSMYSSPSSFGINLKQATAMAGETPSSNRAPAARRGKLLSKIAEHTMRLCLEDVDCICGRDVQRRVIRAAPGQIGHPVRHPDRADMDALAIKYPDTARA